MYHAAAPDWSRIDRIYQEGYHVQRGHAGDHAIDAVKQATARAYLRLLRSAGVPGIDLLEIGCSAGAALEAAAGQGWAATGLEVAADAAAVAARRPGVLAVHAKRLDEASLADRSQDVVVMFDVLEHIDPPQPTLDRVFRVLRPGGLLLVVTPDAGSLSARVLRSRWPHLFVEHVLLFSRAGLAGVLTAAGFKIERMGFAWKRVSLGMLVRHAVLHPHVPLGFLLRAAGRILPGVVQRAAFPFNVGEFYMIARRP